MSNNCPTLTESSPPGTGWCDSVISTFVMLRFPNQCVSTPHPGLPTVSEAVEEAPHGTLHTAHGFGYNHGCSLVFWRRSFTQLLHGQIMSISRVKGMKILQISYQFCMRSHGSCFHVLANAWLCLVMCLLMWPRLCESEEVGKRWDLVLRSLITTLHYFLSASCHDDSS